MDIPNYIFQLSREDIKRVFAMVNAQPGTLIRLEQLGDSVRIGIDEDQLKLAMWSFSMNGGFNKSKREEILSTPLYASV